MKLTASKARFIATCSALSLALLLLTASPADGQAAEPDLKALQTCIAERGGLSVLMLFDQSASLSGYPGNPATDPNNVRIDAARALLRSLTSLSVSAGAQAPVVEIALAGFDAWFNMRSGWTPLDAQSRGDLERSIEATFSNPQTGVDTDFALALIGAQTEMARHRAVTPGDFCQAVVLFTDGSYSIEPRSGEKPYARGVSLASEAGVAEALRLGKRYVCGAGTGVVEKIRADGVTLLTVALASNIPQGDLDFIRSLAEGQAGDSECGGNPNGASFNAEDSGALVRSFDEIGNLIANGTRLPSPEIRTCAPTDTCSQELLFPIDGSLTRIHVLAEAAVSDVGIEVVGPDGIATSVLQFPGQGRGVPVSEAEVTWEWLSPRALSLDIELPGERRDAWSGTWRLRFYDLTGADREIAGSAQIYLYLGLQPVLIGPAILLQGEAGTLSVEVIDERGDVVPYSPSRVVTASIISVSSGTSVVTPFTLVEGESGTYAGALSLDAAPGRLQITLSLVVNVSGQSIPGLPGVGSIDLLPPVEYPSVAPTVLDLGVFIEREDGLSTRSTTLTIEGGSGPGCVWFTTSSFHVLPEGVRTPSLTTSPEASSQEACISIDAGQRREVRVSLLPLGRGSGRLGGTLIAHLSAISQQEVKLMEIAVEADMYVEPRREVLVFTFLALFLLGLALPMLAQYGLNYRIARFEPTQLLQFASVPLIVGKDVLRGDGRELLVTSDDFENFPGSGARVRRVTFSPGDYSSVASAPLSFTTRISRIPILPPAGFVESEGRQLVTSDSSSPTASGRIPLSLSGVWIFVLEGHAPLADDDESGVPASVGTLHLFANFPDEQAGSLVGMAKEQLRFASEALGRAGNSSPVADESPAVPLDASPEDEPRRKFNSPDPYPDL